MNLALNIEQDVTLWDAGFMERRPCRERWIGCDAGQHRILRHLGSGGMGHVFLAEHRVLGVRAAVKILPARSESALARQFAEEAWLLSQQNHLNIVKLFDVGELSDGSLYMVMEYAPEIDLESWLEWDDSKSPQRVLRVLRQLGCAIDHLHAQGILHRDIKPANIMIDPGADHAIKLIDFGIATLDVADDGESCRMLFGTPAYMAPEQAAGTRATRATDLYAFGALALELVTGKPPYDYPSLNMTLAAVLYERPSLPSDRGLCVPALDVFFERALARDPAERFASARELVDALEVALQSVGDLPKSGARAVREVTWTAN